MDTNQKKTENLIAALVLLAGLLGSVFYIFGRERAEFNLDYTDTLLWAAASVESKALISPDFWYAYIIPFSGSLLMIPLVMIFGVSYLTHELGMTVFILVLAAAVFFCVKAVGLNNGQSAVLTGLFLLLLLGSPITRMIYFGHVIHYSLAILFTCVSILLLNHTDKTPLYYILFVWCLLCSLNGSSALLLFLFPITGAIVLERLLDPEKLSMETIKKPLFTVCGMLSAGLLGAAVKQFYIGGSFNNAYEENFSSFLGHERWLWKEQSFLLRFITLLTGWVSDGDPLLSLNGAFVLLRFLTAVLLLIIPVFALISYRKYENRMMRLLVLDYWVLFGLTQLIYSVSYVQTENWRLGALLGMSVLVSVTYLFWLGKRELSCRFGYLGLLLLLLTGCINIVSVIRIPHGSLVNGYDRLTETLLENNLTYGYSELWNGANVTTVLSDSKVKIRPVYFSDDGGYEINPYQSEASWYEDQPDTEEYFVLVTASEREKVADTLVKNAVRELEFEDGQSILVFNSNIFRDGQPVY